MTKKYRKYFVKMSLQVFAIPGRSCRKMAHGQFLPANEMLLHAEGCGLKVSILPNPAKNSL